MKGVLSLLGSSFQGGLSQNCRQTLDPEWTDPVVERYMHASICSAPSDPARRFLSNAEPRTGTEEILKNIIQRPDEDSKKTKIKST